MKALWWIGAVFATIALTGCGGGGSSEDVNRDPVAVIDAPASVKIGDRVRLSGARSYDPDGQIVYYYWVISKQPAGSAAMITFDQNATPYFIANIEGEYEVSLLVRDSLNGEDLEKVMVRATNALTNAAPVAVVGPSQSVRIGSTVTLDGSASSDPDGDALSFSWSLVSKPASSAISPLLGNNPQPTFLPDVPGTYIVSLTVSDGEVSSSNNSTTTITVSSTNAAPIAVAGPAQQVVKGAVVTLDGSASTDADNDPLTYQWTIRSKPAGSIATLSSSAVAKPTFTADIEGSYTVALTVNDGKVSSDTESITVVTASSTNAAPIAFAGPAQQVVKGAVVTLDGSASTDADNDPLTYQWTIRSKPAGSIATLSSSAVAKPTFTADIEGSYTVALAVNDGKVSSDTESITTITVTDIPLSVTSTSFADGGVIPLRYAASYVGGSNDSPALSILNVPAQTKYLAIVMDDEVAPCGVGASACRHWGVFNLPPSKITIVENENLASIPGVVLGMNSDNGIGYVGPFPPSNHLYKISVYALDQSAAAVTGVPSFTRSTFETAYSGKILSKATYTGRFPN